MRVVVFIWDLVFFCWIKMLCVFFIFLVSKLYIVVCVLFCVWFIFFNKLINFFFLIIDVWEVFGVLIDWIVLNGCVCNIGWIFILLFFFLFLVDF